MVTAVPVLLVRLGSGSSEVAVAVFVSLPFTVGFTTTITVACDPLARLPIAHVTNLFCGFKVQLPWEVVADPKPAFLGNVSVRTTPLAEAGPPFVTVIV